MLKQESFLGFLKNFLLFPQEASEAYKIVCRFHFQGVLIKQGWGEWVNCFQSQYLLGRGQRKQEQSKGSVDQPNQLYYLPPLERRKLMLGIFTWM